MKAMRQQTTMMMTRLLSSVGGPGSDEGAVELKTASMERLLADQSPAVVFAYRVCCDVGLQFGGGGGISGPLRCRWTRCPMPVVVPAHSLGGGGCCCCLAKVVALGSTREGFVFHPVLAQDTWAMTRWRGEQHEGQKDRRSCSFPTRHLDCFICPLHDNEILHHTL